MRISDWSSDVCSSDLLKKDVEAADAVLFVTPEYKRAMPGVLKNALDIASRPWATNSFAGKPAGVLGISVGAIGTALATQHLPNTPAYLEPPPLGPPELFMQMKDGRSDDGGQLGNKHTRRILQEP